VSKSAVSRRFVALSAERMKEWMATDLFKLDLLIIQIDGIPIADELMLLAAVGIDSEGGKHPLEHPLGVIEGARENAAVAQALLDNLIGRSRDPKVCRLFIIDRAKALRCPRRSATPAATPPRSSVPDPQGLQHHRAPWPRPCGPACARPCVRRGNWTMPIRRTS
jgi:putative transposase